jgi:hypothetical protein
MLLLRNFQSFVLHETICRTAKGLSVINKIKTCLKVIEKFLLLIKITDAQTTAKTIKPMRCQHPRSNYQISSF